MDFDMDKISQPWRFLYRLLSLIGAAFTIFPLVILVVGFTLFLAIASDGWEYGYKNTLKNTLS